jgi:hypothetical protein
MKCKKCKQIKPIEQFALFKGYRNKECRVCSKGSSTFFIHPESFYNLFIGKEEWRHMYFEKTITTRKS